ncbi:MAG TPA: hypothetical protein VNJ02_05485 [Vicinamibacterales bacterium]|nr:hypothetical protein [Vicinamibacterales bacterium]
MQVIRLTAAPQGFGQTQRRDNWWATPLLVFVVFTSFIVYATWAAFQNAHYEFGPYLSPFYAPVLWGDSPHAWFGPQPAWWPGFLPFSPALLILPFPGLFRFTCYYYRGAYYKAFWADPPACSVGEPRKSYLGENSFPLILQNVHRYLFYIAMIFVALLAYDVWLAMWFTDPATGGTEFGIGVGTLVLLINVILIASYTFGCHSGRHLFGGRKDEVSKSGLLSACYDCTTGLNQRHMLFAWCSLFSVALADVYVRLCSMGILRDWRIL